MGGASQTKKQLKTQAALPHDDAVTETAIGATSQSSAVARFPTRHSPPGQLVLTLPLTAVSELRFAAPPAEGDEDSMDGQAIARNIAALRARQKTPVKKGFKAGDPSPAAE